MKFIKALAVAIAAAVTLAAGSAPATAAPAQAPSAGGSASAQPSTLSPAEQSLLHRQARNDAELRAQIDLQLRLAPGGKRVGSNQVSYADGKFVVTYALPGQQILAAPDCPGGWFCFYDGMYYGYPRGMLSDCGWQDLAWWGWQDRTSSIHNNTNRNVDYINHQDYGNPANGHYYDYRLFTSLAFVAVGNLGAGGDNKADHVNRLC